MADIDFDKQPKSLDAKFRSGFRKSIAAWAADRADDLVALNMSATESPIEAVMSTALELMLMLNDEIEPGGKVRSAPTWRATLESAINQQAVDFPAADQYGARINVWRQLVVGPYRTDFVALVSLGNGRVAGIVIECDGFAHHYAERQQIERDHARDVYLQTAGFIVMRFTGSQLWRDCMGCAKAVMDTAIIRHLDASYGKEVQALNVGDI